VATPWTEVVILLDFHEGSSLMYSARAHSALKTELTVPASIDSDEIVIRGRLAEQQFYDELDGFSLPTTRVPTGRDGWVALMTTDQIASW
jgi:hypothetical protein